MDSNSNSKPYTSRFFPLGHLTVTFIYVPKVSSLYNLIHKKS